MNNTSNDHQGANELLKELRQIIEGQRAKYLESIAYDHKKGIIIRNGNSISLTERENQLFNLLSQNTSSPESLNIITPNSLRSKLWQNENVTDAAVRVVVMRLREKLEEDPSSPKILVSIYGKGYALMAQIVRIIGHNNYSIF